MADFSHDPKAAVGLKTSMGGVGITRVPCERGCGYVLVGDAHIGFNGHYFCDEHCSTVYEADYRQSFVPGNIPPEGL